MEVERRPGKDCNAHARNLLISFVFQIREINKSIIQMPLRCCNSVKTIQWKSWKTQLDLPINPCRYCWKSCQPQNCIPSPKENRQKCWKRCQVGHWQKCQYMLPQKAANEGDIVNSLLAPLCHQQDGRCTFSLIGKPHCKQPIFYILPPARQPLLCWPPWAGGRL